MTGVQTCALPICFKWGLVAELEKPDKELRKNILRNKIHRDGLNIPENVINFIAENVDESVRELEGIVNSLLAQSILFKRDIDLDLAERIIRKAVRIIENKPITIEEIITKVCEHYKMDESVLHTKSRKREIVQVRQVAMYLAKKHTDTSTSKIGYLIGKRDHATVIHACKIMKDLVEVDKDMKAEIEEIAPPPRFASAHCSSYPCRRWQRRIDRNGPLRWIPPWRQKSSSPRWYRLQSRR